MSTSFLFSLTTLYITSKCKKFSGFWLFNESFQQNHTKKSKNSDCSFVSSFVCVEVLWPSQPNGVMSSAVSLPNHTFIGQA